MYNMLYGAVNTVTLSLLNNERTQKESLIERNARDYVAHLSEIREFSKKHPEVLELPEGLERSIYMGKVKEKEEKRYNEVRERIAWGILFGASVGTALVGLIAAYIDNY